MLHIYAPLLDQYKNDGTNPAIEIIEKAIMKEGEKEIEKTNHKD